jgi:rhamnulokinase
MGQAIRMLAADLGAESGRAIAGSFDGERMTVEEVHRFPNRPVEVRGTLHWDVLALYAELMDAIRAAGSIASVGIDTWGVDYGLLDRAGQLIDNPVHYRDRRTEGMLDEALRHVPRQEIYARTGIQFMPINTLYQLLALARSGDPRLDAADRLLTMPALFAYWLCGVKADEFTDATTTQCYDPLGGSWAKDLLNKLGIPDRIFGEVVPPGTELGSLPPELAPGRVRLIAPGTHDTASAVAGVPFEPGARAAYICSGTWSLVGLEVMRPVINEATLNANLTNEGGVGGTFRLLKNVMGLWLLQECKRAWAGKDVDIAYDDLLRLAGEAQPFEAMIDPDDERLLRPGDMPARIESLAAASGMSLNPQPGSVARCILESLALKYRWTVELLEQVTGSSIDTVHVVGGGANNRLLCQMTADASGRRVVAGPVEATAIGNLMEQAIALGLVTSLTQARQLVKRSIAVEIYEPAANVGWDDAWERFRGVLEPGADRRLA